MPQKKGNENVKSDRDAAEMKRLRSRVARRIKKIFGELRQIPARRMWVGGVSNDGKRAGVGPIRPSEGHLARRAMSSGMEREE